MDKKLNNHGVNALKAVEIILGLAPRDCFRRAKQWIETYEQMPDADPDLAQKCYQMVENLRTELDCSNRR